MSSRSTQPFVSVISMVSLLVTLGACEESRGTRRTPMPRGTDAGTTSTTPDAPFAPRVDGGPLPDSGPCTPGVATEDLDGDGWTPADGDCLDCSPQVNPGAFDDPTNDVDEDCDGTVATAIETCDESVALASSDPRDAARSIGLCRFADGGARGWGVLDARWTRADGTGSPASMLQQGNVTSFGAIAPRAGRSMLALSSGIARAAGQPGYTSQCDWFGDDPQGSRPSGLDPESRACPGVRTGPVYDPIALEVRVRAPSNARGFRFSSNFFTYEYPDFICSEYNDFFVVLMEPRPAGSPDGNLVFDAEGNKVSVNNSLLRACSPGRHGGRSFACPLGTSSLSGTSFDGSAECGVDPFGASSPDIGASTGWLATEVPVTGGAEITLRFAIWDSSDPDLDSLALIDGFEWLVEDPGIVATEPVLF